MTATLPSAAEYSPRTVAPAADHLLGATPREQADLLAGVVAALAADCASKGLRATGFDAHASLGFCHATVTFGLDGVADVDALGDAYGLPPAAADELAYDRVGPVTVDGRAVTVRLLTARPELAAPIPVASERADAAVTA